MGQERHTLRSISDPVYPKSKLVGTFVDNARTAETPLWHRVMFSTVERK